MEDPDALIFSLSIAGFRWRDRVVSVTAFHKLLYFSTILSFAIRIYSSKVWLLNISQICEFVRIVILNIEIYMLYIFGISFGFLGVYRFSVNRIAKYFDSKKNFDFLEIVELG